MASAPITRPEAKRHLSSLVDDLARHVDYLREEGVTEVDRSPAITPESSAAQAAPQKPSAGMGILIPPGPGTRSTKNGVGPVPSPGGVNLAPLRDLNKPAPSVSDADISAELKAIAQMVGACKKCGLHAKRRQAVPGQGNIHPDILFIGEGPGEDEDKQGLAFIGRAGQLLTRLITRMGYTRDEVFIANIVKCRPPNNRKPLPEEMNMCRPYLERQIAVLKPKTIVLLGASAFEGLIPPDMPGKTISKVRGKWLEYQGIPTMPTFHPSYLLRNQSAMWDVWNDMQLVLTRLGRTPPPPAKGK
ncbi:MAG: uracil-DNA glycosylase [Kiritimatiellae bacterium]|nr:uracil-DNA glycosylase [Kiritimatiellia bacterium]